MTRAQKMRALNVMADFMHREHQVPTGLTGHEAFRLADEYGVTTPASWKNNHGSVQVRRVDLVLRIAKETA